MTAAVRAPTPSKQETPPFVVIGNPGHRRVTMFQAALAAQGLPTARVVPWVELAEAGAPARWLAAVEAELGLGRPAVIRIESTGEVLAVERALLRRGEAAARAEGAPAISARALARLPDEVGRIVHPRQHHLGFLAVLDELAAALASRPAWRVVQPPAAIAELFDKRATSTKWQRLGLPVPDVLPGGDVRDPDDLRARMRAAGWPSVFVKVSCASSASCLAVFSHREDGEHAMTTVEEVASAGAAGAGAARASVARYNTRKLRRVAGRRELDRLLRFLLGEGAQIERAIPKARLDGRYFDLRVLAIDGAPAFVVVRTAPQPITNLHLGGQRGDLNALRALVPPAAWEAAMASCVAVQRATGAFHVGVDVMFEPDLRAHRVIEGNAFGDLLPNLVRDGLDVYGWQIRRLREPCTRA